MGKVTLCPELAASLSMSLSAAASSNFSNVQLSLPWKGFMRTYGELDYLREINCFPKSSSEESSRLRDLVLGY
jgi:hypothetical protein